MTTFPTAGYVSNSARTEAEMKAVFDDWLAATKQLAGGAAQTQLTIASGTATPTGYVHSIETEGAAAADDLANIAQTNLPDGSFLLITMANGAHIVTVKHAAGGAGQISLVNAADFVMAASEWLMLERAGALWIEITRFFGTQAAAHRTFYAVAGFGANSFTARQDWAKGGDVASAGTLSPGNGGNYFHVTGTTTITAIASMQAGTRILLEFDSAGLQLTYNATSLILSGARDYITRAGDVMEFVSEGSGNWRQAVSAAQAGGTDLSTFFEMHEDFVTTVDGILPIAGTPSNFPSGSYTIGGTVSLTAAGSAKGVIRLNGTGSTNPGISGPYIDAGVPATLAKAADAPIFSVRCCTLAASTLTRRAGLCRQDTDFLGGDPADGIFVRWTNGNYIAVCRSGGAETTLDTGVASGTTLRTFTFEITSALVRVYVDNVLKGTIATNIPTAALFFSCAKNSNQSGEGFDLDYWQVKTPR